MNGKTVRIGSMGGALALLLLGVPQTSALASAYNCNSVKDDVVKMSQKNTAGTGMASVVGIAGGVKLRDRTYNPPTNGVVLKCRGKAILSTAGRQQIYYGVKAIDGDYYIFLKPA